MTILLIKSLIWGDGEKKSVLENVIDEDVDDEARDTKEDDGEKDDDEKDDGDENESDGDNDENESDGDNDENESDGDNDENESDDEDTEDETLEYESVHSRFEVDFYKEIRYVLTSFQFQVIFYSYMSLIALSMAITSYNWSLDESYVTTPTLPFYEKSFSVTPFLAQRASAIAHLPYVPSLLLGISYFSPEMCETLNPECISYAYDNRLFLWIQFALQLFTSVVSLDATAFLSEEISIALSYILLYNFFNLTTPNVSKNAIDTQTVSLVIALCASGFLTVGLVPVMLIGFIIAISVELIIPGAFSLLTQKGRLILLYSFLTCVVSLLIENIGCVSDECPWHVIFNLLFWQVLGSVVDVVILSPRPGRFLILDDL